MADSVDFYFDFSSFYGFSRHIFLTSPPGMVVMPRSRRHGHPK